MEQCYLNPPVSALGPDPTTRETCLLFEALGFGLTTILPWTALCSLLSPYLLRQGLVTPS